MNQLLQIIELDISDPKSFTNFMGNIKVIQKPTITFYDHKIKYPNGIQESNPSLHIIVKVDGRIFKIILVDGGSTINIILATAYKNLNLPFSHICTSYLQLKSFNDALCLMV